MAVKAINEHTLFTNTKEGYNKMHVFRSKIRLTIFAFLFSLFLLQIGLSYAMIRQSYLRQTRASLKNFGERILSDIEYKNNSWDIRKYLSDPLTPHPHGSSGFSRPLYIIDSEGFVLERNMPVRGYLDSSDYSRLLEYSKEPVSFNKGGEQWRVYSKPIQNKGEILGVIFVAYYQIGNDSTTRIDAELIDAANLLSQKITFKDKEIIIDSVDIRDYKFNISFEIVSSFNKVLLNNGRTPSFIDKSYVYDTFKQNEKIVTDGLSGEKYLLHFDHYINAKENGRAVIISGESLTYLQKILSIYLFSSVFLSGILLVPLFFILDNQIIKWIVQSTSALSHLKNMPKSISFNSKASELIVDNTGIRIPFASNQYYLVSALFESPKKRWETDELLDRMGEVSEKPNKRTLYDAALALNKKVSFKLVSYDRKTYFLNPQLLRSAKKLK